MKEMISFVGGMAVMAVVLMGADSSPSYESVKLDSGWEYEKMIRLGREGYEIKAAAPAGVIYMQKRIR